VPTIIAPEPSSPGSYRTRLICIGVLLTVFALGWANWRAPVLRLASPSANIAAFIVVLLTPAAALVVAFRRPWMRWISVLLLPIAAIAAFLALFAILDYRDVLNRGQDFSFELVRELPQDGYVLRVYRTNGGATTAFGVVVRQERSVLPGIRLVRDVYRRHHADDAQVDRSRPGRFVFDGRASESRTLSPWVWF
jgi:hypothetical protein